MSLYEHLIRPLAFLLAPETAHDLALRLISRGWIRGRAVADARLRQRLLGLEFPNPLGLAAGFDKNGVAAGRWGSLGFGFAELGTVTRRPQPGNPRPRLFRLPEDRALINRMGFNNEGAEAVAARLQTARSNVPLGINLGKSRIAELASAPEDYAESFRLLRSSGAYFVVNVSSPNTPGLRSLQEKGPLLDILHAMRQVDAGAPLFVKVSPDLETAALDKVIDVAHEAGLAGLIATNTTTSREGLRNPGRTEEGGLSGAPLRDRSNALLAHLFRSCEPEMVLIGVGGIFTGRDLMDKIEMGAHLAQMYTGWVYGGPATAPRLLGELLSLLQGADLAQVRGNRAPAV